MRQLLVAACVLLAGVPGGALAEGRAGGQLRVDEPVAEDLYAAAGTVLVTAAVDGDAVLAGGTVGIAGDVASDALIAGGSIDLDGVVGDDLRALGGTVTIRGLVTDQAIVAGGTVLLAPEGAIGGRAWLAGSTVDVSGQIGGNLRVTGGTVTIAGRIGGDVELTAREIRILPGAVIAGDFLWHSPREPEIAEDARILGNVAGGSPEDEAGDFAPPGQRGGEAGRVVLGLAVFLAAAALWWLFPGFVDRAGAAFRAGPGRTLAAGALAFVATPVVILLLFVTLVGWLLAFVLLAGYAFALAATGLVALAALAGYVAERGGPASGWGRRFVLLLLLTVGTVLLQDVPGVGGLVTVLLWITGLGMTVRALRGAGAGATPPQS